MNWHIIPAKCRICTYCAFAQGHCTRLGMACAEAQDDAQYDACGVSLAEGLAWETIIEQWHNSITEEAIAEAVKLSSEAFLKHADEFVLEPATA